MFQIVVDKINDQSHEILEDLLRLSKMVPVLLITWNGASVQRFPSILLTFQIFLQVIFRFHMVPYRAELTNWGYCSGLNFLLPVHCYIPGILIKLGDVAHILLANSNAMPINFTIRKLRTMRIDAGCRVSGLGVLIRE